MYSAFVCFLVFILLKRYINVSVEAVIFIALKKPKNNQTNNNTQHRYMTIENRYLLKENIESGYCKCVRDCNTFNCYPGLSKYFVLCLL